MELVLSVHMMELGWGREAKVERTAKQASVKLKARVGQKANRAASNEKQANFMVLKIKKKWIQLFHLTFSVIRAKKFWNLSLIWRFSGVLVGRALTFDNSGNTIPKVDLRLALGLEKNTLYFGM
jgi:hypothetical protein